MLKLISNARVFAPKDLGVCHVLVGGGRILGVSDKKDVLSAAGATEYDFDGRRLIPGFIDGHAHVTGGGGEAGFSTRVPPVPLGDFTTAGITSVVGVLGTDDTTRDTRSLLAQTRALREEGLGAWCHTGGYHVPPVTLTGSVRDDIVFLDPVIGVGELAISDHRSSQPTLNELLRIASDAHVAGMIAGKAGILHLHLGDGDRGLDLIRCALAESELPARVSTRPTSIVEKRFSMRPLSWRGVAAQSISPHFRSRKRKTPGAPMLRLGNISTPARLPIELRSVLMAAAACRSSTNKVKCCKWILVDR